MRDDYKEWLRSQEYSESTQASQIHRVGKVEQFYGSLDDIFSGGRYDEIVAELQYSSADERMGKPNPSRLIFDGNIRKNLQSYKNAVVRYRKFLLEGFQDPGETSRPENIVRDAPDIIPEKQKLSLERDMQAALRRDVTLLDHGLTIIDDGAERSVASGFIDILCMDDMGKTVVIELKAGKTDPRVIGQILGYMGDLMAEDEINLVRGIIVAHEFDKRTIAASKAVPNLQLMRYSVSFRFEPQG